MSTDKLCRCKEAADEDKLIHHNSPGTCAPSAAAPPAALVMCVMQSGAAGGTKVKCEAISGCQWTARPGAKPLISC